MFKKVIAVILLIALCSGVFALDLSNAEPYEKTEFPKFALDLRRSEIIFFGGLPIVYPLTSLALKTCKVDTNFWKTMAISCSVSAVIALADYIIGLAD